MKTLIRILMMLGAVVWTVLFMAGAQQVFGQNRGNPMPFVQPQFFGTSSGQACGGCLLYSYAAGTTNPVATYTDNTLQTANANPLVLNSLGRPPGSGGIWMLPQAYKFVLQTATGATIWTQDNVTAASAAAEFYPEAYGAKGDDTTDDCTALTSAVNAAAAVVGGSVYLSKLYYSSCGLTITANIRIHGTNGWYYQANGTNSSFNRAGIDYHGSGVAITISGTTAARLDSFSLMGTSSATGGILMSASLGGNELTNLDINTFPATNAYCVKTNGAHNSIVRDSSFRNCYDGILWDGNRMEFSHNFFFGVSGNRNCMRYADSANGTDRVEIIHNTFQNCAAEAIYVSSTANAVVGLIIRDNFMESATLYSVGTCAQQATICLNATATGLPANGNIRDIDIANNDLVNSGPTQGNPQYAVYAKNVYHLTYDLESTGGFPNSAATGHEFFDDGGNVFVCRFVFADYSSGFSATNGAQSCREQATNEAGPYSNRLVSTKLDIANSTTTGFVKLSVPNANEYGELLIDYALLTPAHSRYSSGHVKVTIARQSGVGTITTLISDEIVATASGAETATCTFSMSAPSGAVGAIQTTNVQVNCNTSDSQTTYINYKATLLNGTDRNTTSVAEIVMNAL